MLQHAVLVNAGFMSECIFANDRFVARCVHAGDVGDESRGGVQTSGVDTGLDIEELRTRLDRHDGFLKAAVAGALTDAVDRAFDLPRSGLDRRQ